MKNLGSSRVSLALAIIGLYLLPFLAISAYSIGLMPLQGSWNLFSIGLAVAASGSCILLLIIYSWENKLRQRLVSAMKSSPLAAETPQHVEMPDPEKEEELARILQEKLIQDAVVAWQAKHEKLAGELSNKEEELHQALEERKGLQTQVLTVRGELDSYRDKMRLQQQQEQTHNATLQKIIEDQRTLLEAQLEQISALEIKEKELAYEIKTLVSLTNYEASPPLPPQPPEPALTLYEPKKPPIDDKVPLNSDIVSRQLSHLIETAANVASGQHLHGIPSHLYDLPSDNYALELRRLCENLNMENRYIVFLHSPREKKLLFVNDHIKSILGWTPEKFLLQFSDIVHKGMEELQNTADTLSANREAVCALQAKSISDETMRLKCHLRAINAGTFRNHTICLLYPHPHPHPYP